MSAIDDEMRAWFRTLVAEKPAQQEREPFAVQESTTTLKPFEFAPDYYTDIRVRGTETPVVLVLLCDSIAASKSKCGFVEFAGYVSNPPKFYLNKTRDCAESGDRYNRHTQTYTTTDAGLCSSSTVTTIDEDSLEGTSFHGHYSVGFCPACSGAVTPFGTQCYTAPVITTTATNYTWYCSHTCQGSTVDPTATYSETLDTEYTTDLLITTTEDVLPDYSGTYGCGGSHTTGQGCLCSAFRNLSTDESSYTIRRFKHKFTIEAQSEDYDVRWKERFTPESGGSPIIDTDRSTTISAGATESSVFEVLEPTTDGTTTIECAEIKKSSDTWPSTTCWP